MKPNPRTEQRLVRQALIQVGQDDGIDRNDVENRYWKARTAIHDLHHDDWFAVAPLPQVEKLLKLGRTFVHECRQTHIWPEARIVRVEDAGRKLLEAAQGAAKMMRVSPQDIDTFIAVNDEIAEQYRKEGYDPDGVIDPRLMVLTYMIRDNFGAYEKTLNYEIDQTAA